MNPHKKQSIQKLVVQQSGSQILDLNDIVLGYDGARIVGSLLPQYHKNLRHIKLNGNNIDSQGFQFIFTGLLHCTYLKSIEAEWNHIGSSDAGLAILCKLVASSNYLQFIDLKNNRISHHLANYIAQIIQSNKKNLRVIDLRWNDLGELGAKQILSALGFNRNIKFIGLEDNRISMSTLVQIQNILKNGSIPIASKQKILHRSHSQPMAFQQYFPISSDEYASMDTQLRTGQLRNKIQNEQKQANRHTQKLQIQIQKIIQKIKLKGAQMSQMQIKFDSLMSQNASITSQLRQTQRMLALQKQRCIGIDSQYAGEMSQMRNQKYKVNNSIQNIMEKYTQRNQRELDQIDLVMGQKLDRLNAFYKQKLHEKRVSREKLAQLKEDIMKYKINKQQITNTQLLSQPVAIMKNTFDQQIFSIKQLIAQTESTLNNETKKGEYLSKQLNSQILKALNREQNLQKQIFNVQNKIKDIHHNMTLTNLQVQKNLADLKLKQSEIFDKQATIQMQSKYMTYLRSQGNIKLEVESMLQEEIIKSEQTSQEGLQSRIAEVERALRAQQAQNRMIKNQYEKLMSQMQNVAKKNIQLVLFE